ncbi:hypothetical protein MW887_006202 [Aspergillus wentii]|nr:hypothetical protein MW887_006202 [Aspergillus wentii]
MARPSEKSLDCSVCKGYSAGWIDQVEENIHKLFHSDCDRCSTEAFDDILCDVCRHLRIAHLHLCVDYTLSWLPDIEIGIWREVEERGSRCRFCQFISNTCYAQLQLNPDNNSRARPIKIDLRSKSTIGFWFSLPGIKRHIEIHSWVPSKGVDKMPWRSPYDPCEYPPPPLQGYVDWDKARRWMHTYSRSIASGRPKNLKVIDVVDDQVVHAPTDCEYLALSYVFGGVKTIELPPSRSFKRDNLPATIRDAILACDRLGYRFLWVDQLCINQSNPSEVQEQIAQMNHIYRHATCTLVALEGDDSNHGLPRVTVPQSWQHTVVDIGRITFSNKAPALHKLMDGKRWLTRGWTLQEGYCSSAMLFFTNYGVYYSHSSPGQIESETICEKDSAWILPLDMNYWGTLVQYTERELSYQTDILHAFTAVLQATHGDRTYHGLPLDYIDQAIAWEPDEFSWKSNFIPWKVRDGFPSWSWTSHVGPIRKSTVAAGLAIWAIPESATTVAVCKPSPLDEKALLESEWHEGYSRKIGLLHKLVVAWLGGCVPRPFPIQKEPSYPSVDFTLAHKYPFGFTAYLTTPESLSHGSLLMTLYKRWPTYSSFWHDAFGHLDIQSIFTPRDCGLAYAAPGRILFHGQSAYFYLDTSNLHHSSSTEYNLSIRSRNGSFAGMVTTPEYYSMSIKNGVMEFILMSIGDSYFLYRDRGNESTPDTEVLEKMDSGIMLRVMLINRDPETSVARRVGIGAIALKIWVDAGPQYKTVILE